MAFRQAIADAPMALLLCVGAAALTIWLLPQFSRLAASGGLVRPNYRGRPLPLAQGLAPVMAAAAAVLAGAALGFLPLISSLSMLVLLWGAALAGLVDDALGGPEPRGLRGHLAALAGGRLSTGGLKLLLVSCTALAIGVMAALAGSNRAWPSGVMDSPGWPLLAEGGLNGAVIALMANALNLFDLRPGRAGKVFLAGALAAAAALFWAPVPARTQLATFWPLAAAVAAYLPGDLAGRVMLGDSGANPLGAALGLAWVWLLPLPGRVLLASALVLLHAAAERTSFSRLVDASPWLHRLDRLGRRD